MKNHNDIASRAYLAFALLCVLGIVIIGRVFYIQVFESDKWADHARGFTYVLKDIEPSRGQIFSSDGSLLATSVPEFDIFWDSQSEAINEEVYNANLDSLCIGLSKVLGNHSPEEYKRILTTARSEGARYKNIDRKVDYLKIKQVRKLPFIRLGKFKSGFVFNKRDVRKQPYGMLASRTIGEDRDVNPVGIEMAFNKDLEGKMGQRLEERIPGGAWKPMTDDYIIEPQEGADIHTTIDINIQDVTSHALLRQMEEHQAEWGTAIVMEVATGEVKAIANLTLRDGTYQEIYNHAIGTLVEPGSTFKLPSLMTVLDANLAAMSDSIDTGNGVYTFHDRKMRDSNYDKGGNGVISIEQVFELSSNIGTALALSNAFDKQPQVYLDKLQKMGIDQPLGISIKGEVAPQIHRKAYQGTWSGVSLTQMAIGYEVRQTPLQTLAFYNAVANGGIMVQPRFVKEIKRNGKTIKTYGTAVLRKDICSKSTLDAAQQMMEGVCKDGGTADYIFRNAPYTAAGKTGTAKINKDGRYLANRYRASFVGYFPADAPKYSCIVVINDPRSGIYYGSTIAAPVFRAVADRVYATHLDMDHATPNYIAQSDRLPVSKNGYRNDLVEVYEALDIPMEMVSEADWVSTSTQEDKVEIRRKEYEEQKVPDVRGMGLSDALYLLESRGLTVKIKGSGTVKKQSVTAGAWIKHHSSIILELS